MGNSVHYEQGVQCISATFVREDHWFQNSSTFHWRFAESAGQVRTNTSAIESAAVPNQAQSSGLDSMAVGHITQAAGAPLIALENEMINMISTLHLAFRKLASKSKTFVSLAMSSAV